MIEYCAEAGQTMRGDVGLAVEMVHAFAEAGATHFKVQMLDPDQLVTRDAPSYWQTGPPVEQHASFVANGVIPHTGWDRVRQACYAARVGFVATPFDLDAVHALADLEPDAVKVASGDITFLPLLRAVGALGVPVFVSTGASRMPEVRAAVATVVHRTAATYSMVTPLACTLRYPTPQHDAKLIRIPLIRAELADMWSFRIGYSDHTLESDTSMFAVLAGARLLEKHVTMFPGEWGHINGDGSFVPDDAMGLNPRAFAEYVQWGRLGETLLSERVDDAGEAEARTGARRAARFARAMPANTVVGDGDVTYLRPCDPDDDGRSILLAVQHPTTTRAVEIGERLSDFNCMVKTSEQPA